jgi:hypothetical protein
MPKRSAPSSPAEGVTSKKQKLDNGVSDASPSPIHNVSELQAPDVDCMVENTPVKQKEPNDVAAEAYANEALDQPTRNKLVAKKSAPTKQPPVHLAFDPWRPNVTVPPANPFWGIKPRTGDARPHADQPSARDSNAATNPPLWEDRTYRFKRGSRYVKYFGPIKPEGADDGPDLDQEDLLVIKLIDMRPKSKHERSPRRTPTFYCFESGKPKDWNSMQAIKALNDRRGQAIDRITADAPWTRNERDYLASLLVEHPDASIWELTELHNDYFMDREFADSTGFAFAQLSTGRTVESVRHEYLTYKPAYDNGAAPEGVRWRKDKSVAGKALEASKRMEKAFGPSSKKLENEFDGATGSGDDASDDEGTKKSAKKAAAKKVASKRAAATSKKLVIKKAQKESEHQIKAAQDMAQQPKLADEDEDLLNLAGLNAPEQIRASPPRTSPRRAFSFSSDSDMSDVPEPEARATCPVSTPSSPGVDFVPETRAASRASSLTPEIRALSPVLASRTPSLVADTRPASPGLTPRIASSSPSLAPLGLAAVETGVGAEESVRVQTTSVWKAARDVVIDDNYDDDEEL